MLQFPSSWPNWSVWVIFGALLAGLDLAMSFVAAMVVRARGTDAMAGWFAAGTVIALVLFWVFSSSLTYGGMLEMNVLWIGALLALLPAVNAAQTGQLPGPRVIVGLIGMIVFVTVIQWPAAGSRAAGPGPGVAVTAEADLSRAGDRGQHGLGTARVLLRPTAPVATAVDIEDVTR